MQEQTNTEIEDFLADESFQSWVRTNVDLEKRNMDFRKSCPRKISSRIQTMALSDLPLKISPSSIVQTALLATWNKIETNETSERKIKSINGPAVLAFCLLAFGLQPFVLLVILPKSTMNSYI
jgi:hypothetical protein